mmetsp:Transcript_30504/g.80926  ORF Transcript_30504/g.80926 Transcript_30504/m.80926 type:complete len:220 (-) Transcript_30504:1120-1779(-)
MQNRPGSDRRLNWQTRLPSVRSLAALQQPGHPDRCSPFRHERSAYGEAACESWPRRRASGRQAAVRLQPPRPIARLRIPLPAALKSSKSQSAPLAMEVPAPGVECLACWERVRAMCLAWTGSRGNGYLSAGHALSAGRRPREPVASREHCAMGQVCSGRSQNTAPMHHSRQEAWCRPPVWVWRSRQGGSSRAAAPRSCRSSEAARPRRCLSRPFGTRAR